MEPQTITKFSKKTSKEVDVIVSDRVSLIREANSFVSHMITKEVLPSLLSGINTPTERDRYESDTYISALSFLKRQFDLGHKDVEVIDKKVEQEISTEETK